MLYEPDKYVNTYMDWVLMGYRIVDKIPIKYDQNGEPMYDYTQVEKDDYDD